MAKDLRKVFVVHGRDEKARSALFAFLRSVDLRPLEWSELVHAVGTGSPYIGEVLDRAFEEAQAVVVLLTPDDVACLQSQFHQSYDPVHETQLTPQARPNVLFEAGMAMGRNPERTILVEMGQLRPFSDVAGRHSVRLNNTTPKRQDLAMRLERAGCKVNLSGSEWHTAGDLTLTPAPSVSEQSLKSPPISTTDQVNTNIQFMREHLSTELDHNLSLLRAYQMQILSEKHPVPAWSRNVWQSLLPQYGKAVTPEEYKQILGMFAELDTITPLRSALLENKSFLDSLPAQRVDAIRRGLAESSITAGLTESERMYKERQRDLVEQFMRIRTKLLSTGNPLQRG